MEAKLFWKSVIRRKTGLLLLLALLTASAFGFLLRTVEYLAVSRGIDQVEAGYQMIGSLSSQDGDVTEGVSLVEESPYVGYVDINRCAGAVLSGLYNADIDGISSIRGPELGFQLEISDILVWAEVTEKKETVRNRIPTYQYDLVLKEAVYGYPEYTEPGKQIHIFWRPRAGEGQNAADMEVGRTYLIKCYYDGYSGGWSGNSMYFKLKKLEEGIWFREGEPDERVAAEYIDENAMTQERNRHAMLATTAVDMSAWPAVQENARDFYLEEGRWLDRQDQEEGRRVCVVEKEFARIRGLHVGDTLTLTLRDAELFRWGYVTSPEEETWETREKVTEDFEIVGTYGRLYGEPARSYWPSFGGNYLYLPDSCLPEEYVNPKEVMAYAFSFVLTSPKDKEAFIQELEEPLKEKGITISFVENNWDSFYEAAKEIRQGAFYSLLIFGAVLAVALGAAAFLYLWQRKKEIAIARALGVPVGRAAFGACLPMLLLGGVGIFAGGGAAWNYGFGQAKKTMAALKEGIVVALPVHWFVGICLLIWLVLILAVLAGTFFYARQPVLGILQGGLAWRTKTGAGRTQTKAREKGDGLPGVPSWTDRKPADLAGHGAGVPSWTDRKPADLAGHGAGASSRGTRGSGKGMLVPAIRFVGRYLRHVSLRTLFALLASAIFITASCWLHRSLEGSRQELDRLYCTTQVGAEIIMKNSGSSVSGHGGAYISHRAVKQLWETGFIKDQYLEAGAECFMGRENGQEQPQPVRLLAASEMEQYLAQPWNDVQIQYASGYDETLFEEEYELAEYCSIVVPKAFWDDWELTPGEKLEFMMLDEDGKTILFAITVKAGGFHTGTGGSGILVPMSLLARMEGGTPYYTMALFTLDPEKNRELDSFRADGKEIVEGIGAGLLPLKFLIRDRELVQSAEAMEKNIMLLEILYPLANVVSFLAAIGLSVLFLLQRRREAAILRVLGIGIFPVRLILILELFILYLAGMAAGAGLAAFQTAMPEPGGMAMAAGCYFLGGLAGTIAGAVLVTRGRPLELLQE